MSKLSLKERLFNFLPIQKFVVRGDSMLPTLRPGDQVLVWRPGLPDPGDVVVAKFGHQFVVKRVQKAAGDSYELLGDNPRAGRSFIVPETQIVGRVFFLQKFDEGD